jgi:hypothetical protein
MGQMSRDAAAAPDNLVHATVRGLRHILDSVDLRVLLPIPIQDCGPNRR